FAILDFLQRGLGGFFLVGVVVENCRAVLRADVGALAILGGGIVAGPEGVEQFFVADQVGVVGDQDGFGVAGEVGADILIGGIFGGAAGVADRGGQHAGDVAESFLDAPE